MSRSKDLADSAEVINFLDNITTDINSGLTSKLSISTNLSDLADADVALVNLGLTATATELNYTDGVTSNIQTQLDTKLASASYTASDVLTKIKTVDGTGSGLDADLLDGQEATAFATAAQGTLADSAVQNLGDLSITATAIELNTLDGITATTAELNYTDGVTSNIQTQLDTKLASASYTASDVLTKVKTVDGTGSGLDADLLDGQEATAFATAAQGTLADSAVQNLGDLSITATATELNTLDGITATTTELNYTDGVTSNIQTQLDTKLASASYTASDVLTKIKTVDGASSGLDADLLDGQEATAFATAAQGALADSAVQNLSDLSVTATAAELNTLDGITATTAELNYTDGVTSSIQTQLDSKLASSSYTASDVLTKVKTVDGAGSGLDADLLDGQQGSYYTGYADTAVANLVASAPSTLDTLNELAAALGDDPNFATTVTNSIATKAPIASPTFTGTVTIPTASVTGNITVTGTVDGRDVAADGTKLDGIESGATADQTAAEILTAVKTVDGTGSGLDADLLDGQQGSYYLNASNINAGTLSNARLTDIFKAGTEIPSGANLNTYRTTGYYSQNSNADAAAGSNYPESLAGILEVVNDDTGNGLHTTQRYSIYNSSNTYSRPYYNGSWGSWAKQWNNLNDGTGSGLDADLLDGQQGTYYAAASSLSSYLPLAGGTMTGTLDLGAQNIAVDTEKGFVNSGAWTRNTTPYGYIDFGPANTTWAHIYTDRPNFYFNKNLYVSNSKVFHDTYHPNADTLTTARTINGVSFNGSANITLPTVNTSGDQTVDGVKTFSSLIATNPTVNAENTSNDGSVMRWRYSTSDAYQLRLKQTVTTGVVRWNFSQTNNSVDYNDVLVLDRGNVGIGTTAPSQKLNVVGNAEVTGSIYVADNIYHSGDTDTYLGFGTNTITLSTGGSSEITVNTTGVRLGDTGNGYFQPVTGTYGSVQIDGGDHGGYEGYSIGGRAVFMHDNSSTMGLYDDVNDQWAIKYTFSGKTDIRYAGNIKLETTSTGANVIGTLEVTNVDEGTYSFTGTALDPGNGGIQYKTLAANTTFTDSLADGESMTLRLEGGATYTVTWPTMTWITSGGNVAPTLNGTKDVIVLWKEGTTLYGAYVGYGA